MKILIIDPQFFTRSGLIYLLTGYTSNVAIYEATDFQVAESYLTSGETYDLIFTELDMPDIDHKAVVPRLLELVPDANIVLFTWRQHQSDIRQCLSQGASSYLRKDTSAEEVKLAVHGLLQGRNYIPDSSSRDDSSRYDPERRLSPRQQEIMQLLAQGLSNKEIANILGITEGTIRVHLSSIFKAIKVSNRTEATLWYLLRQNKVVG
ncbi:MULTISPECIES: response regulator transcription factor [Gammaproteobacteria]|uniref:LuxR C-terminal-related transcriptional regulator n=1 Tax=Gammaproteobacteria TaxID=1236 RepID=UPI000DCF85B3|nr:MULTISPECIES: response regulator transcription factor [Gammaproteobacteria]RTE85464.1 response regulator transcription factor [Aliidiomarina sp. B3213]TCZ89431.1 response regulator transcription factor [Lysobacter sp. N42]